MGHAPAGKCPDAQKSKTEAKAGGGASIPGYNIFAYVHTSSSDAIDCFGESDSGFRSGEPPGPSRLKFSSLSSSSLSDSICSTEICLEPLRGGGESEVIPCISGDCSGGGGGRIGDTIVTGDRGDCGGVGIKELRSCRDVVMGSPMGVEGTE